MRTNLPRDPWTELQIIRLLTAIARGDTLKQCAQRTGHYAEHCDEMAWLKVGRSPRQARHIWNSRL